MNDDAYGDCDTCCQFEANYCAAKISGLDDKAEQIWKDYEHHVQWNHVRRLPWLRYPLLTAVQFAGRN